MIRRLPRNEAGIVAKSVPTDFDSECFFIAPIGEEGTEIRKRSDGVRDFVVKPAAAAHGLEAIRADDVGEPGQITAQAVQHCLRAKAAVADLTNGNPNVYYELSVRHGAQLPVVLIADTGTKLPFDISQSRVIFFDPTDLSSAGEAREELGAQIAASLDAPPDNPIYDGMRLAELQAGNAEEQTLALVLDRLQRLANTTEQIDQRLRVAEGGWVSSPARLGGRIRPRGRRIMLGNNLEGYTVHSGDPAEIEEVFGPGAFDTGPSGLTDEEKAEILAEHEAEQRRDPPSDPHGDPEVS